MMKPLKTLLTLCVIFLASSLTWADDESLERITQMREHCIKREWYRQPGTSSEELYRSKVNAILELLALPLDLEDHRVMEALEQSRKKCLKDCQQEAATTIETRHSWLSGIPFSVLASELDQTINLSYLLSLEKLIDSNWFNEEERVLLREHFDHRKRDLAARNRRFEAERVGEAERINTDRLMTLQRGAFSLDSLL